MIGLGSGLRLRLRFGLDVIAFPSQQCLHVLVEFMVTVRTVVNVGLNTEQKQIVTQWGY